MEYKLEPAPCYYCSTTYTGRTWVIPTKVTSHSVPWCSILHLYSVTTVHHIIPVFIEQNEHYTVQDHYTPIPGPSEHTLQDHNTPIPGPSEHTLQDNNTPIPGPSEHTLQDHNAPIPWPSEYRWVPLKPDFLGEWKSVRLKHYPAYPIIMISLIIQRNLATKIWAKWESSLTAVWLKWDPPVYITGPQHAHSINQQPKT